MGKEIRQFREVSMTDIRILTNSQSDQAIKSFMQVGSGTLSYLCKETNSIKLGDIQNKIVLWALKQNKNFTSWMNVWEEYKQTI
jgi:hypothetical protein